VGIVSFRMMTMATIRMVARPNRQAHTVARMAFLWVRMTFV